MDKLVSKKSIFEEQSSSQSKEASGKDHEQHNSKQPRIEMNLEDLPSDPGLRPKITSYNPNDRDKVRRYYLQKGPCQPRLHDFPKKKLGDKYRRFCPSWFNEFGSWLEYSIEKDAAYCLHCYLFRPEIGKQSGGDTFVTDGFSNWSHKSRFNYHVSGPNSAHNIVYKRGQDLMRHNLMYSSLVSLILMYFSVIDVLEIIQEDGGSPEQKGKANFLLEKLDTFDFVFLLHLLKTVLGISNELSKTLQRKDQDIINAMGLVKLTKQHLQNLRDSGWETLLNEVSLFCTTYDIDIPNMEEMLLPKGRSRRRVENITNFHYYRIDLFYNIVDMQLQELSDRFNEINTKLLLCLACLNPDKSFLAFDKQKLIEFAKFYPNDFSPFDLVVLENQLETYIIDMRSNEEFSELKGIGSLAEMLVKTGKDRVYTLVYSLIKLALILPIATATVERAFSAMKIVKNRLRNRMEDKWLNDCLVTYIERDVFDNIDNELIIQRFQTMSTRR